MIDDLVDRLYEALIESPDWSEVLGSVRAHFGADGVLLQAFGAAALQARETPRTVRGSRNGAATPWFDVKVGCAPGEAVQAQLNRLVRAAPPRQRDLRHGTMVRRLTAGAAAERPVLAAHCAGEGVHVLLALSGPAPVAHPRRQAEALRALAPHLWRVLRARRRFDLVAARAHGLEHACERLAIGVVQTDAAARPLWANTTAREALAGGVPLAVDDGRLATPRRDTTRRLHALIAGDGRRSRHEKRHLRLALVHRESAGAPLLVFVVPGVNLPTVADVGDGSPVHTATLFLVDTRREEPVSPALLARIFPFTAAEARIAALLLAGGAPGQVARDLNVTRDTVRQHLKRIFDKTSTHRQAELIALLAGTVSWLRAGNHGANGESSSYPNGE